MTRPPYRDIMAERGARAAACVDRHLANLAQVMVAEGVAYRTVEGSAVAAEVFLADTNTLNTAVRVAVFVTRDTRRSFEAALRRAGFAPCDPTGDVTLLRLASRGGRRPIHVLFGDDASAGAEPRSLHPGAPEAARQRALRLGSAWLDLAATFRRVRYDSNDDHDVTESFEVQLIER